ncbi:MAG: hypothetical protein MJD61_10805 [Proteobacteria bacterium]|nr:hypothetical protein [Pseudomonadota bacterium]
MVLARELLRILVCPESHLPLAPADDALLKTINEAVEAGTLRTRGGRLLTRQVQEALVREDHGCAYLVEDGLPNLLIDERIDLVSWNRNSSHNLAGP